MLSMKTCVAFLVLVLCVIGHTNAQAKKLVDVYDGLSTEIKDLVNKYKNQTNVNYDQFISELTGINGFDEFKTDLDIKENPYTKASLTTLFEQYKKDIMPTTMAPNNAMRNGVALGSVVMVSVMSMLIVYLN